MDRRFVTRMLHETQAITFFGWLLSNVRSAIGSSRGRNRNFRADRLRRGDRLGNRVPGTPFFDQATYGVIGSEATSTADDGGSVLGPSSP
jgi:hypothetical protein